MPFRRLLACLVLALAVLPRHASAGDGPVPVIASFSIPADLVAQVGGPRVSVTTLVGPDGDVHGYQPTPEDARRIAAARLVFINGAGLEGWLPRLISATGRTPETVDLTAGLALQPATEHGDDDNHSHDHGHDHDHGPNDPHAWQDVGNVRHMIAAIRDRLSAADPQGAATYSANATAYLGKLDALERDIRSAVASLPPERRRLITSHDAFGYFARAYGITFLAARGIGNDAEPSARDVAMLIRQIRAEKIPAVFLENASDPRLMQQISAESGARIGGTLYADALSDSSGPAGTYIAMMQHNIREISMALAP